MKLLLTTLILLFSLSSCMQINGNEEKSTDNKPSELMKKIKSAKKGFTGLDLNGKSKTCTPVTAGVICTEIFTPSDEYAIKCRKSGGKSIQCGCHDWICIGGNVFKDK